jgi:hypothetical protein
LPPNDVFKPEGMLFFFLTSNDKTKLTARPPWRASQIGLSAWWFWLDDHCVDRKKELAIQKKST